MSLSDDLFALERQLLQPATRADRDEVAALLADEFREFGRSGRTYTKQEIIDALVAETQHEITLDNFTCQKVGPNTALVTYRSYCEDSEALRSSLWVRRESRWQMLFHQGTAIPYPMRTGRSILKA